MCLRGGSETQKVLDNLKGQDVKIYSAWEPMLPTDAQIAVGRATKSLTDPRVSHFWDADAGLAHSFAPVLGIDDGRAWDVYLLYDQNAEWKDTPPKPVFWQEHLGISQETKLDSVNMTAEINKLFMTK